MKAFNKLLQGSKQGFWSESFLESCFKNLIEIVGKRFHQKFDQKFIKRCSKFLLRILRKLFQSLKCVLSSMEAFKSKFELSLKKVQNSKSSPRKVCSKLVVDKNFVVKWPCKSFVCQSYQIGLVAWKPDTLIELVSWNNISAEVVER